MTHSERISINEKVWISDRSRRWNPLSLVAFGKERNLTYTRETSSTWLFGVQTGKKSGVIIKHNYWFYYYVMTAMFASIYIFILSVNVFRFIIPYHFIFMFLVIVSTLIFFGSFIGLIILIVYVSTETNLVVPESPMSVGRAIIFIAVPMVLFVFVITTLAQFIQNPLVMVGLVLLGIDLILFWYFYGVSLDSPQVVMIN